MNSCNSRLVLLALVLGALLGTAVNVPLVLSQPTVPGGGVPFLFQGGGTGIAAPPGFTFSNQSGASSCFGWAPSSGIINFGNGATGGSCVIVFRANNQALFGLATSGTFWSVDSSGNLVNNVASRFNQVGVTFANIGTVLTTNGDSNFCSDCKITTGTPGNPSTYTDNTCTSGGNGAWAVRLNGVARCYQ